MFRGVEGGNHRSPGRRLRLRLVAVWLWTRHRLARLWDDTRLRLSVLVFSLLLAVVVVRFAVRIPPEIDFWLEQTSSFLKVVLGALVSLELFAGDPLAVDRKRLNGPGTVVDHYHEEGCEPGFVGTAAFVGDRSVSASVPDRLPVVPEARPDRPVPLTELDVVLHEDRYYDLPDRIEELYGPFVDRFATEFVDEGHFNEQKLRPIAVEGDRLELGRTTFFNNFVANLSADYELFDPRTPRELLHTAVFDDDGTLEPLTETDMPYIAASSGLLFSTAGETVLPIRSGNVVIQGWQLGESFGGSWDWEVIRQGGPTAQVQQEFTSERTGSSDLAARFQHLGTMRRVDLMGKPDNYLLGYVDGDPDWEEESDEHVYPVVTRVVPEGETIDGPAELYDRHEVVLDRILDAIADSPYEPSVGLLTWLWLFDRHGRQQ